MIYIYKVTYFDDIDTKDRTETGIVYGKNYAAAAKHLTETYDPGLIDMYLEETEREHLLYKEELEEYSKELNRLESL